MPHDINALKQITQEYHVVPLQTVNQFMPLRLEATPHMAEMLAHAGYDWDDEKKLYVSDRSYQYVVALPHEQYVWMMGTLARILRDNNKLKQWIEGRGEEFTKKLMQAAGADDPVKFGPTSLRSKESEPKGTPLDKVDILIAKIKRQGGAGLRIPADTIIDLYQKAKAIEGQDPEGSKKLMAFVKTLNPIREGIVKKSTLNNLLREIVKGVLKEAYGSSMDFANFAADIGGWDKGEDTPDESETIARTLWGNDFSLHRSKSGQAGDVYVFYNPEKERRMLWKRPDGRWLSLDANTKKWTPVPDEGNPSEGLEPLGGMEENVWDNLRKGTEKHLTNKIGQDKIDKLAKKLEAEGNTPEEARAKAFNTLAMKPDLNVDEMTGTGAVSPISTPFAFKKKAMEQSTAAGAGPFATPKAFKKTEEETLDEMTTTGAVTGYNVPSAFSKRGGSNKGVQGSEKLGYTLTPIGKKEMKRHADKLWENTQKVNEKLSTDELVSYWKDDKNGEYIQINDDGSTWYVAHGKAMEQIAPKGTGDWKFRLISGWFKKHNVRLNIWSVNERGNLEMYTVNGKPLGGLV